MFLELFLGFLFLLLLFFLSNQIALLCHLAFWWSEIWDPWKVWFGPGHPITLVWDNSKWPVNFQVGQPGTCSSSFPCLLKFQGGIPPAAEGYLSSDPRGTTALAHYNELWGRERLWPKPLNLSPASETSEAWGKYRASKEKLVRNELGNHQAFFPHFTGGKLKPQELKGVLAVGCSITPEPAQTLSPHSPTWPSAPKEPGNSGTRRESTKDRHHIPWASTYPSIRLASSISLQKPRQIKQTPLSSNLGLGGLVIALSSLWG